MQGMNQIPGMNQAPDMNQMQGMNQMPGMQQPAGKSGAKWVILGVVAAVILFLGIGGFAAYKFMPSLFGGSQRASAQPSGSNVTDPGETPDGPDMPEQPEDPAGDGVQNAAPAPVDTAKQGTQNRQEGNTIYVVDGGLYNDTGSYNMDFYDKDEYVNGSFACRNSAMTIVDGEAFYYINSALDVNVEAVDVNYGGISYFGNTLFYVTGYGKEKSALYLIDKTENKKYMIDEEVSGYNTAISPNGKRVAYSKYMENGPVLFMSGIGMEAQEICAGNCDILALSDDGQLIYGVRADDYEDDSYSMYCYKGPDSNKLITEVAPQTIYVDNDAESFLMIGMNDRKLYYFDGSMSEVKVVYDSEITDVFGGTMAMRQDYNIEIIPSSSVDGVAFTAKDGGTMVFVGADKEPFRLAEEKVYNLPCFVSSDECYYAVASGDGTIAKYQYKPGGTPEVSDTYTVEGNISDVYADVDLEYLWYCNRDGQLFMLHDGESNMIAEGITFNHTYSAYYNPFDSLVYVVKDGKLCSVDRDGNIKDTGCECDSIYPSYKNKLAVGYADSAMKNYIYVAGRAICEE